MVNSIHSFLTRFLNPLMLILALATLQGCKSNYTMEDFARVEKIDAHVHLNSPDSAFIEQARADNFKLLAINVDYPDFPPIEDQLSIAVEFRNSFPSIVEFASTFRMDGWGQPDWGAKTLQHLDSTFALGAVAVKVWKNIGMDFRNADSQLVMIDDPGFDPIFAHLREKNILLIGHQGEPKNCWLPIEEMTVNNDKPSTTCTCTRNFLPMRSRWPPATAC